MANTNICISRKAARGPSYLERCPNKKRPDSNYCGKHINSHIDYIDYIDYIDHAEQVELEKVMVVSDSQPPRVYTNTTDFYTLDTVDTIPKEYLYEYVEGNLYYAFDIRTLYDYLQSCNPLEGYKNPYTHLDIPKESVEEIKKTYKLLLKRGISVDNYKEDIQLEPHKALEWRCLGIFQKINELGHYSEYKWFWNLKLQLLKRMYIELEDLWNYRIYLTNEQKQKILPKYKPFRNVTISQFSLINDIDDARTILLDEIERFITMGRPEGKSGNDNKYTGSIFVLTALVEVSPTAAIVMPHLVPIV
jgi:hypothetical protein